MGGGPYYAALGGSRILNASRADQSGADDADVTNWTKTNDIIFAVNIHSNGKDTEAAQYKLRWRDETDNPEGAFGDLDTTGEAKFGATDLVNGTNIVVGGRKCDSQGDTWQVGEEVEGTKLSDSIDLADDYETELHFSVSLADGDDGHQYTFDLYDDTRGAQVGVLAAQITLAAGAQTFYETPGQGSMIITGSIVKQTSKPMGAYAMAIAGSLGTVATFPQAIGGGTISPVGTLAKIPTYVRSVGQAAMSIAGSLIKKGFKDTGAYAMTITGSLATATIFLQAVGAHAMVITGTLAKIPTFVLSVGGAAMTIAGGLAKKTSIFIGKASMSIVGSLAKATTYLKSVGGGSISPLGALNTVGIFLSNVGGATLTIVGTLAKQLTQGTTVTYFKSILSNVLKNIIK